MARRMNPLPPYEWPEGKRAAAVFSADVDAETPFIWANRGKPVTTLGELEQRRFGPRRGLHRIVELLDEFSVKGSFYVPGAVMEIYPWIVPGLLAEGHEVGLHGYHHEGMQTLDDDAFRAVMARSLEVFRAQGGRTPVGFRSPAWELGPQQVALLDGPEIAYDSSLMGWEHPYRIGNVTEVPVHWTIDDAIFFRYFGGGRDTSPPTGAGRLLSDWLWEFDAVVETGGLFMITVHPWMSGRAGRVKMLRRLFAHIAGHEDVWWTTTAEVARWHDASANADRYISRPNPVNTDI